MTERDDQAGRTGRQISATEENIELIRSWERSLLHRRSATERLGDAITSVAASAPVLLIHGVVFAGWILINGRWIPGLQPFDPFPFPFLTLAVSLEAIFLALFVLASQNRLTRQSDRRGELDLQIDLLSEREMTAVLQLLQDIATHLRVQSRTPPEQMKDLINKTDVEKLAEKVDS